MSPALVSCPACLTQLRVAAEQDGKRLRCPKCKHIFLAAPAPVLAPPDPKPTAADPGDSDRSYFQWLAGTDDPLAKKPALPPEPAPPVPDATPGPAAHVVAAPRRKPVKRPTRPVRHAAVEDHEPNRSGKGLLFAGVALALGLMAGLAGAAVYVAYTYLTDDSARETAGAAGSSDTAPARDGLAAAAKVKAATVAVRGVPATGQPAPFTTGFVVPGGDGLVVTSARAVGHGRKPVPMEQVQVKLIGQGGAPRMTAAQVLGADPDLDLALLRLAVPGPAVPPDFADTFLVKAGSPVVAYSAAAEDGTYAVTATDTTVAGLRTVSAGREWFVLAAGLPTAGGPVTDASGKVIGVAGTVPGTTASAVVPAETVRGFVQSALRSFEENGPVAVIPPGHMDKDPTQNDQPDVAQPNPFPPNFPRPPRGGQPIFPPAGFDPPVMRPPGFPQPIFPPGVDLPPRIRPDMPPPGPPRPKIAFPVVPPADIKPAPLTQDRTEVKLPGKVTDACVGGGGRYWLLHLPGRGELAVFDTAAAKVVKSLPVGANVKFAAGMTKLVVADPDTGQLTRYDLTTHAKEDAARFPFDGTLRAVTTGAASGGPLVVSYKPAQPGRAFGAAVAVLDVSTLKEFDPGPGNATALTALQRDAMQFRSSPDGRVVTAFGGGERYWFLYRLSETGVTARPMLEQGVIVSPAEDGTILASNALYAPDARLIGPKDRTPSLRVPAQQGPTYLAVVPAANPAARAMVAVHVPGTDRPLVTLPDGLAMPPAFAAAPGLGLQPDRRVLYSPAAHLIGSVAEDDRTLVLHRFDLDAALAEAATYLYVTSRPPAAVRGQRFEYAVGVKSKKGGVTARLESGPVGMAVTGTTVTWEVPRGGPADQRVVLRLTDAAGQEATHTFVVSVRFE